MELKAFWRSRNVMFTGSFNSFAWSKIMLMVDMCSTAPDTWRRKPFWVDELISPLARQYFSKRQERILWNNLPIADVRAIGRKDAGFIGFSPFLTRISLPLHQASGDYWDSTRILVNRSARKGWHAGSIHRWWYKMRSSPGDELLSHDLSILLISSGVIGTVSKPSWMDWSITSWTQVGRPEYTSEEVPWKGSAEEFMCYCCRAGSFPLSSNTDLVNFQQFFQNLAPASRLKVFPPAISCHSKPYNTTH